jgi:hypothetical protein
MQKETQSFYMLTAPTRFNKFDMPHSQMHGTTCLHTSCNIAFCLARLEDMGALGAKGFGS